MVASFYNFPPLFYRKVPILHEVPLLAGSRLGRAIRLRADAGGWEVL